MSQHDPYPTAPHGSDPVEVDSDVADDAEHDRDQADDRAGVEEAPTGGDGSDADAA